MLDKFKDSILVFLVAALFFASSYAAYQHVDNNSLRSENAGLKQALDKVQQRSNFPHCVNVWPPYYRDGQVNNNGGHVTVCGSIETIQYSLDGGNFNVELQKEINPQSEGK